jgi:tetratricopeptide (TPR) repeat protein
MSQPLFSHTFTATISAALAQAKAYHRAGELQVAEKLYRQIVQVDPAQGEAYYLLGTLCHALGKLDEAAACLERAVQLAPDQAPIHNHLGVVRAQQGKMNEATACFQQAVRLAPDFGDAQNNLQKALTADQYPPAATEVSQAQAAMCDSAAACYEQGVSLASEGKLAEAAERFRQAVRLKPDFVEAHYSLAAVLRRLGQVDEALCCSEETVKMRPDSAEAHLALGTTLLHKGRASEAETSCREALRLKPDLGEAHNNLGAALAAQWKLDEAIVCWRRALELKTDDAAAQNNLGFVLFQQGRFQEALACYDRCLELTPDCTQARNNRSLVWLLTGKWEQGWPEFQWWWQSPQHAPRHFTQPMWDGCALPGKTILLHAEQGLGDTIQFVRYVRLVKQQAATVIVECQRALVKLLGSCPGIDQLVAAGDTLPPFDVHAPLLTLPAIFHTTLSTVPAGVPYLFADEQLVGRWRGKIEHRLRMGTGSEPQSTTPAENGLRQGACSRFEPRGFKIGIAWQGNPDLGQDRHRSFPLSAFAPLAEVSGTYLVSLQKGAGSEQLAQVGSLFSVVDFTEELDEASGPFMDTAALMTNLDLVVTSDTSIAHLAGALGVPVWVALASVPDWRWLLDRSDCPWYPTMRLFRQKKPGDWSAVFEELHAALHASVALSSF